LSQIGTIYALRLGSSAAPKWYTARQGCKLNWFFGIGFLCSLRIENRISKRNNFSRSAEPGGKSRKVLKAATEGTMVTAWVRASQGTSRYSANRGSF